MSEESIDVNKVDRGGRTALDLAVYKIKDPEFEWLEFQGLASVPLEFRHGIKTRQIEDTVDMLGLFAEHGDAESRVYYVIPSLSGNDYNQLMIGQRGDSKPDSLLI